MGFYKVHQSYFLIDIQYQNKLRKGQHMSFFRQNEIKFYGPWPQMKQDINTPTENSHNHEIYKLDQMLKRLRYLEKKCEYLQVENEVLRDEQKEARKVHIKIEVIQKKGMTSNIKSNVQFLPRQYQNKQKIIKRRRTEKELIKNYRCPYDKCKKQYASSLALNLHIRNKHGGGTKRQRKSLLKHIIQAELKGQRMPEININLPPNYIEDKKQLLLFCEDLNQLNAKKGNQQ